MYEIFFDRIREGIAALQAGTGAKISARRKPVTVHAWGGARLGPDPEHGVVDHNGEVRVLNGSQPPPSFRRRVGGEAPDNAALPLWLGQLRSHHADGAVRISALA